MPGPEPGARDVQSPETQSRGRRQTHTRWEGLAERGRGPVPPPGPRGPPPGHRLGASGRSLCPSGFPRTCPFPLEFTDGPASPSREPRSCLHSPCSQRGSFSSRAAERAEEPRPPPVHRSVRLSPLSSFPPGPPAAPEPQPRPAQGSPQVSLASISPPPPPPPRETAALSRKHRLPWAFAAPRLFRSLMMQTQWV